MLIRILRHNEPHATYSSRIVLSTLVNGQTLRSGNQKTRKGESDAEPQQRRATAASLLQSPAVEARSYSDDPLRARVQAQIADALFRQLVEQNFYQALNVSKTFRADAPRALTMIAVARSVLVTSAD